MPVHELVASVQFGYYGAYPQVSDQYLGVAALWSTSQLNKKFIYFVLITTVSNKMKYKYSFNIGIFFSENMPLQKDKFSTLCLTQKFINKFLSIILLSY